MFAQYSANKLGFVAPIILANFSVKMPEDTMSMASLMESRFPLFENELVVLARRAPTDLKYKERRGEYIFRGPGRRSSRQSPEKGRARSRRHS